MVTEADIKDLTTTLRQLLQKLSDPGTVSERHVRRVYSSGTDQKDQLLLGDAPSRIGYSIQNKGSDAINIRTSDEPAEDKFSFQLQPEEFYESPYGDPHPYRGKIRMYFAGSPNDGDTVQVTERLLKR